MNRTLRKKIKSIIASVLFVTMLFSTEGMVRLAGWICGSDLPDVVMAATSKPDGYVSEVKIYEGSDSDALKSQMEKDGYYYVDQDMNQGAGGSYTYLGYKTSQNKDDAITNMKILSQDTGFRNVDYGSLIDANSDQLVQVAKELFAGCKEYSRQLQVGSPAATFANKILNMYYFPEADGRKRPLGDFLADQSAVTESILFRIISRSSSTMVSTIFKYIALGVSSYEDMEGSTWISRLSEEGMIAFDESTVAGMSSSKQTKARNNFWTDYDTIYKQNAINLTQVLGDFAKNVTKGMKYAKECGGKIDLDDEKEDDLTLEQIAEKFQKESDELLEHDGNYISEENEQRAYVPFLIAYDAFNEYDLVCDAYGTTKVGEYLVALGNNLANHPEEEDYRNAYGLIRSLSGGQYTMTRMNGVLSLLNSLCNQEEAFESGYEELDKIKASLKENGYGTMMSVWIDTDEDMYQQKVAVTDAVSRGMKAGSEIKRDRRNWAQRWDAFLSSRKIWIDIVSDSVTLAYLVAALVTTFVAGTANIGALSLAAVSVGWWAGSVGYVLAGCLGMVVYGLSILATAVAVILLVWGIVDLLVEAFYPTEEVPDYQKDKIPWVLYDSIERRDKQDTYYYVKYYVALNQKDEPADVNGYSQKLWDVIYYTKESWAGSPIRTDDLGEVFKVFTDLQLQVKGYESLSMFGNSTAANLNIDTKSSKNLYLYYRTEASIKEEQGSGSEEETNSESKQDTIIDVKKKYLNDIMVVFGKKDENEINVKRMEKEGFSVIQENLSPDLPNYIGLIGKYASTTYIGIKTTDNPDQAIRDIRVAPYYAEEGFNYGGASYATSGTVKTVDGNTVVQNGKICNGSGLYFTRDKSAGDPILADLKIVQGKPLAWDNEEGWTPISTFSGGVPADFFNGGYYNPVDNEIAVTPDRGIYPEKWLFDHRYVYFRTEKNYNADPDAPTYLAGISFVGGPETVNAYTGSKTMTEDFWGNPSEKIYLNGYCGYIQELGVQTFDKNIGVSGDSMRQYICYTLTHDPNRAIYDIAVYESQNNMIFPSINKGGLYYSACDSYEQANRNDWNLVAYKDKEVNTNYSNVNAFRAINPYHSFNQFFKKNIVNGQTREALYVAGKPGTSGKKPILFEDIKLTDQKLGDGYAAVHSILKSFETEPYNLRIGRDANNPVYMYIANRSIPERPKYIESVHVGVGNGDEALIQALAGAGDLSELVPVNLADAGDTVMRTPEDAKLHTADYADMANVDVNKCAYMMATYTTKSTAAITDLIKIRTTAEEAKRIKAEEESKKKAASGSAENAGSQTDSGYVKNKIIANGKEYSKASDLISSKTGDWLLYTRKYSGDLPISDIILDDNVYAKDCMTMKTFAFGSESNAKGQTICDTIDQRNDDRLFLHAKQSSTARYFGNLFLGVGQSKKEAQLNVLKKGATGIVDYNLNMNVGGDYIYLGFDRLKEKDVGIAICDILITEGKPYEEYYSQELKKNCIMVNGLEYESVGEESLNSGTNGKELHMYYCCDEEFGLEPYVSLYAGLGDSIPLVFSDSYMEKHSPDSQEEKDKLSAGIFQDVNLEAGDVEHLYERVLDNEDNIIDLNAGLFATKDGKDVESRIYLYGARSDNTTKEADNARTFERNGNRITLYGTYGTRDVIGELKMK